MNEKRIESDSIGDIEVAADAAYGAQTQRAINNFPISHKPMPLPFIRALLSVKAAAAKTNAELEQITPEVSSAIITAVEQLLADPELMSHFPVDIFQTGSGTSTNMNANEVLANLASPYSATPIGANDHVNCGQSSNDVIPTTIHVSAALLLEKELLPALEHLQQVIIEKSTTVDHIVKTGRTHLMDAMPVRLSQSLQSWADQIKLNIERLRAIQPQLHSLAQGGTAVGTGVNAHPSFAARFCEVLSQDTGLEFQPAENFFTQIGTQDTAVAVSGLLKACAVSMMKIANDLRWMNSGPLAGLGEISLEALQPGSSIMPGKVNPVIPEAAAMVAAQVIGNDAAITVAGQSSNFELNVMLPLVAANLISSLELLTNGSRVLADKAIATFEVNEDNLSEALYRNPILITALNPIIGYEKAAEIAKCAYRQGRPIIDVAVEQTDLGFNTLQELLNPAMLTENKA
ncbi:MAG: class II fumarate hydratase [Pseudomonadota bacterium]